MPRHYLLAETNWKMVKDTNYELAVLPWGSTEAHNYHLPYSTDTLHCLHVAEQAAKKLWDQGTKVMVLPPIPFGVQTAQMSVKFNINMNPSTQFQVLTDIVKSLEAQGVRKLVIVNGHGANDFVPMLRELYNETKVRIFTANWFGAVKSSEFFDQTGDHADEMETSVMMHLAPDLVLPLKEAGHGKAKRLKVDSLREGWAWSQRGWLNEVTQDTGVGDPKKASVEKGRAYLEAAIAKLEKLFKEVASLNLADPYV